MRVLFLDIDGVLNGHEWNDETKSCNIRRECVAHLNRVVRETDCRIVVSSAWRYIMLGGDMTPQGFGYMLRTHGLYSGGRARGLIIGHTGPDSMDIDPARISERDGERGRQCRAWLEWWKSLPGDGPPVNTYAAIDDEDDGFAVSGIPCVITNGGTGMIAEDADKLIAILKGVA